MNVAAPGLEAAIAGIAADSAARDAQPEFPSQAFGALAREGALAGVELSEVHEQWELVRRVSAADASVGRILDGHLNAVERLTVAAPEPLRSQELDAVRRGQLLLGVWGADPAPGEGDAARLTSDMTLEGVKTFCSGAGGLDRALVLVHGDEPGPPLLAYTDLGGIEIDRTWFRGDGMRSAESHRVAFHGAPVLAVLGEPGWIGAEPWFGRDAMRTSATWAGIADTALDALLAGLRERGARDDLSALAAGRAIAARGTIDAWMECAAAAVQADPEAPVRDLSVALRDSVARACRAILAEAEGALGSRPFATAGVLDRARRDLGIFLLQHRLDPLVADMGRRALG